MNYFCGLSLLLTCACVTRGYESWGKTQEDIRANQDAVDVITDYILNGQGRHTFYDRLAIFSDDHGPRLSGSQDLEDAIDYVLAELQNQGFENVHGEDVTVPVWIRGEAEAFMTSPRLLKVEVNALGESVGTGEDGLEAEAIVVRSFEELEEKKDQVPGKIVVYNHPWTNYGESVEYRANGASEAAKRGAVGALVRSVTGYSINSIHTGHQLYQDGVTKVPVASITVEDAEMMWRLSQRGKTIRISLNMSCDNPGDTVSRNIVADYVGSEFPEEFVIIGGHIDSWDVGYGPMDDGGGVVMSWNVVRILQALNMKPKRTIRLVFWTGEEFGLIGGNKYFDVHKEGNASISLIMESDSGTFMPRGIGFTGSDLGRAMMQEITALTVVSNTTSVGPDGGGPDIGNWVDIGVPSGNLYMYENDYFNYHHSNGDSITMEDPDVLDLCQIIWTVTTYVVANLEEKLPRSGDSPNISSSISAQNSFILMALSLLFCYMVNRNH